MANIRKRGNTYQIRVSCGYDAQGNQVVQTTTWKPEAGMTPRQIEKEVQKQAMLFEEKCLKGQVTANIKFEGIRRAMVQRIRRIKSEAYIVSAYAAAH